VAANYRMLVPNYRLPPPNNGLLPANHRLMRVAQPKARRERWKMSVGYEDSSSSRQRKAAVRDAIRFSAFAHPAKAR